MKSLPFHKASTWIYVALNPARLQNGTAARAASISADPSPFQAVIKVQKCYWFGCSLHFLHLGVQKTLCATYSARCQRNFTASPTSDCLHNAKLLWHQLPTEIRELMDAIHLAAIFGKALLVKMASSFWCEGCYVAIAPQNAGHLPPSPVPFQPHHVKDLQVPLLQHSNHSTHLVNNN